MAVPCDSASLIDLAKCIQCIPQGMQFQVLVSLLCQIANNPSGGGAVTQLLAGTNITLNPANGLGTVTINATASATQVFSGNGAPNGVVTATEPALYYDKVTGILYQKTGAGNTGWN